MLAGTAVLLIAAVSGEISCNLEVLKNLHRLRLQRSNGRQADRGLDLAELTGGLALWPLDQEIAHVSTRQKLGHEPARLLTSTSPGFGGIVWILIFGKDRRIFSADETALSGLCTRKLRTVCHGTV